MFLPTQKAKLAPVLGLEFLATKLEDLRALYLYNNGLYSFVPEEIRYLTSLSELELCTNHLSGVIPHSIGTFIISVNNISESIPPEIGDSPKLQVLDLSSNNIVGEIPVQLGKLFSLNKLILNLNQLSGGMPFELGSLTELQYLDLSTNKLKSSIPKSIGNLLRLRYLDLSNNQFGHKIPVELEKLIHVSELDLSYNFLGEEIPFQICNMKSLEKLNLCHNNLLVSFQDALKECTACHTLTYPIMSYWDQFLIAQHSKMLKWKNTRLCGNVQGLPSRKAFTTCKQASRKKWVVIMFSSLVMVVLLICLIGFRVLSNKRRTENRKKFVRTCLN
ncbi:hypothetical protein WN944_026627 [Citrus x changshan-huyou]|uniref:Uncharacterized protein n=1 Tax=Citrus x changshan-huyou TaxID=2935761 RepID=A0AAP0LWL9_9ROSI